MYLILIEAQRTGRLIGNFPGGIADLKWDFTIAGQQITRLTIAP